MVETPVIADRFVDDLKASLVAWRKAPLLPVVAALLVAIELPSYGIWTFAVVLPVGFFAFGWLGTQLIWYQRAFDGQRSDPSELIPLTWSFVARYFWLICLATLPFLVLFVPLAIKKWLTSDSLRSPGGRIGLLACIAVVGVVGTFMIPALAFTTRRVTKAVPIGLRMIVQGWPENWKYLVLPAVVAGALQSINWLGPPLARPVLDILSALISLVFAGAIARYYLRAKTTLETEGSVIS